MRGTQERRNSKLEIRNSPNGEGGRLRSLRARVAIATLLALLAVAKPVAGQREAKEARVTYRISGVVVDAVTGAGVPGSDLWTTGDEELKTVADGEGRFAFEGVEEGKYPVSATAPGYVGEGLNQHGSFSTGIAVGSGLDSEHVVFKLHRQALIYGRVTDERGEGVRYAMVLLFSEGVDYGKHEVTERTQTQTNDLGAYRFAHLMPGKYYVVVMGRPWWAANGLKYLPKTPSEQQSDPMFDVLYPITYFAGVTEDYRATPLLAKAGDAIEADVQLAAVPSIHVLLTNMDVYQRRRENPSVTAVQKLFGSTSTPVNSINATEVAPGVYEVGGLPPGDVRLTVARGGDAEGSFHEIRVNAVDGESVDAAAKTATCTVSGVVLAAEGSKAEMQGDVVLRNEGGELSSARLAKDGTFRMPTVAEGTYGVVVNTRTSGDYVAKLTASGAKVSGRAVKIEGANEVKLTVAMGRGLGQVEGVVKIDDKPLAGAMVLMVPEGTGLPGDEFEQLVRMDQSDSDGTFTLRGVVPGKYVLMAMEDGWELEWKQESVLAPYLEKGMKVTVGAGQEKKVAVAGMAVGKPAVDSH